MSEPPPDGAWFRPKRFGWGFTPATWQGWAVIVVFAVVLSATLLQLKPHAPGLQGWLAAMSDKSDNDLSVLLARPDVIGEVLAEVCAFLVVVRLTGRGAWKWRWGDDR
jgi:hypothetical protein